MPPNVNLFELEGCLEGLDLFLEKHPKKSYVGEYGPLARRALNNLKNHTALTDASYTKWRLEIGEGKLAYKKLQRAYKRAQRTLENAGAIGYPEDVVGYWDEEETVEGTGLMLEYLKEHQSSLDFAEGIVAELSELLKHAGSEGQEADKALTAYKKISGTRKLAMEDAIMAIDNLRRRIRDDIGREHADYKAIRWPAMVAPDPF